MPSSFFMHPVELLGLMTYVIGLALLLLDRRGLATMAGGALILFQVAQIVAWSGSIDLDWSIDFPFLRPSPALAQLLLGLQLVLAARGARGLWWPLLGATTALLGLTVLATASFKATWFADWWQVDTPSRAGALALLALGLGSALAMPWKPHWRAPLAMGLVAAFLAVLVTQVLRIQRGLWIEETTQNVADSTLAALSQEMLAHTLAVRVLAGDWEDPQTPPLQDWALDAGGAATELPAVLDFVWVQPDSSIGWQFGRPGQAPRSALEAARSLLNEPEDLIAEPHPTHVGSVVLVGIPMVIQGQDRGLMVGLFDGDQLVQRLASTAPEGRPFFDMLVLLEGEPIGVLGAPSHQYLYRETTILDTDWALQISPTLAWVLQVRTSLPEVILVLGVALALALAFGADLTHETRLRARQLREALDALQASYAALEQRVQERTEELRLANADLARSNEDLEQFAAVASHDLKQPLHTISLYLQMLDRRYSGALEDQGAQWLATSRKAVVRMRQLIDELLAYARAGATTPRRRTVALSEVVDDVVALLEGPITAAGAHIEQQDLDQIVEVDPNQLGLVLQNLIGNAVKYRGDSPPRVLVRAFDEPGAIRVEVEDNGRGMTPETVERVFEMFERAATDASGTGVGLAIARRIVERHGGRIGVHSVPGEGSTFWFTLPRAG